MNKFTEQIEEILCDYARQFTPEGSDPKAIVHQWVHAVAYGNDCYAENNGAERSIIIKILSSKNLFKSNKNFKNKVREHINMNPISKPKFTFIDLFAGIGGMRLSAQRNGGTCVFSSEFDQFAQNTYSLNFGEKPLGDVTKIDEESISDHDLLMAGFPCQPFSYAGRGEGFEDQTRGTLFFDVLRIINKKQPRFVLLENVKGFRSHQNGETMKIALKALTELGYHVHWKILNSYDFGLPQYRERWYCIATKDKVDYEFPVGTQKGAVLRSIVDVTNSDPSLKLNEFEIDRIAHHFKSDDIRVQHDNSKYKPHTKKGRHGVYSFQKSDGALRFHIGDVAKTQIQEAFYACLDTYAPTIIANRTPKLWDIKRKLSVIESARLQGFPDDFCFEVSNAQAYKQLGNSVAVPVVEAIIEKLIPHI